MTEQVDQDVAVPGRLLARLAREGGSAAPHRPVPEGSPGLPAWLARTVLLVPGHVDRASGWRTLDEFLAPACLQDRHQALARGLAPMAGEPGATQRCAWALVALNVAGWTLAPVLACALDGLQPTASWAPALRVRAADVGPVNLGIRTADTDERPVPSAGQLVESVGELAVGLRDALEEAGAPRIQAISALASALNTVATDPACAGSSTGAVCSALWHRLVPAALRIAGPPGSGGFRRPSCCGLAELAGDPGSACGDCPSHPGH